jgi:F-type H+-transporting ATPase subunit a
VFTKPASLTIRLFANMVGGHMIVIVLSLIIFILADMGAAVVGATTVVSVCFSIFMLLLDVLVSFIQAYVFTMLSTTFIAAAQERGHEEHHAEPALSQE